MNVHSLYTQLFKLWRRRRFQLFIKLLRPAASDLLLDVGGHPIFWLPYPQPVARIDTLNIHEVPWDGAPGFNIRTLIGDGCALKMESQSYDIGFSNSVIEHLGTWERQQQFASELARVAQALWVQTPAYECPLEPHYMAPFIHYLPAAVQKRLLRWGTLWGWLARPSPELVEEMVETTKLLSRAEMQRLFPDCEILTEWMLWIIPKSHIAIRRKSGR